MPHARKQLRDTAIAALSAISALGGRVTAARAHARNISNLPAAEVSTPNEENERLDRTTLARRIDLQIRVAAASAAVEDDLDALGAAIEAAVVDSAAVQAVVSDIYPASTSIEIGDPGETVTGEMTLVFATFVFTSVNDPQTITGV